MTIGTFARRTGLSVSALRFYADQRLLVPAKVDNGTGYRRYTEDQVPDGVLVCNLRRLEMPLSEIAVALSRSETERKELVERHLDRLEQVVKRANTIAQIMGVTTITATTTRRTTETTMSATLQALDLARALDQVLPAAATDPELPHLMSVLIESRDGSVRLVATDRHRLAVEATCSGLDQQVGINPRFATDAARHAVGAEVVVEIDDPLNPIVFCSADDGTFTSLVMPFKLD